MDGQVPNEEKLDDQTKKSQPQSFELGLKYIINF
jgi:hypothetical protein